MLFEFKLKFSINNQIFFSVHHEDRFRFPLISHTFHTMAVKT